MKSWAVQSARFRLDLQSRGSLTLHGYVSLAMARKLAHDALDKVANGADPASDKQADRRAAKLLAKHGPTIGSASTIDQGFEHYLTKVNRKKGWREATRYEMVRHLGYKCNAEGQWTKTGNGVIDRWTGRPLASITRADIRAVVDDLAEQAPIGANRLLANLKAAFQVDESLRTCSPCHRPLAWTSRERKPSASASCPIRNWWRCGMPLRPWRIRWAT